MLSYLDAPYATCLMSTETAQAGVFGTAPFAL
jgi:hypothetical protein